MVGKSFRIESPRAVIVEVKLRDEKLKLNSVLFRDVTTGLTKRFVVGITWPQESVVIRVLSRYGKS